MSADHNHSHTPPAPVRPPAGPEDAAGQALSETLRSSFFIVKILMVGLVGLFLCSGMFTVGPQEQAMVLRFGRPVGEGTNALLGPGFHLAFPAPIDEVIKIPAGQVRTVTSTAGWYATTPELELAKKEPPPGESLNPERDGYVLTGDANIIHARATLRYRIVDPIQFEFGFGDTERFITNTLNESLNYAAAYFPVDSVLTRDQTAFRERVRGRINWIIEQEQLGIVVEQIDVQARPPRQPKVNEAFDSVTGAGLRSAELVSEAQTYANQVRSGAQGEASVLTNAALSERTRLVEDVRAEAGRFTSLVPKYEANPALYTLQWQAETLQRVFTNSSEKFYVAPGNDARPRQVRLLLSREPVKSKAVAPKPLPVDQH